MNISNPISTFISQVNFSFYEPEDLKKLSIKQITNPQIFDTLDHPSTNGLYDPCLGPHDTKGSCATCFLSFNECPGHFGHIDLTVPVYNPITFKLMYKLLQSKCHFCHHLRISDPVKHLFYAKLLLIHAGLIVEASSMDSLVDVKPRKKESDEEEEITDEADIDLGPREQILKRIDDLLENFIKNAPSKAVKVRDLYIFGHTSNKLSPKTFLIHRQL